MSARRSRDRDAPLLAWGEALRADKARRRRLDRAIFAVGLVLGAVGLTIVSPPLPRLVWNTSPSAPTGLYSVTPGSWIAPGDMVVARVPARFRQFAAIRHYIPANVPLVKRAKAVAGDEICAIDREIFINGAWVARRLAADRRGRVMPAWHGCLVLRGRQLLLLNDRPDSFDGRYFGVTGDADIVGKAQLLWQR